MNPFFAVSLDIDNQREHIIYCSDSIEAFYTNQTDNVFKIERPLGEFIFDFSGLQEQERYNAVTEYLSNFPEHNIVMHRERAYRREEGRLNEADWAAALENYDNELYELWDNIKSHKCPTGELTGGK